MKGYCEQCRKVIDETEVYRFNKAIVCYGCFENLTMIDMFLKLDFLAILRFIPFKEKEVNKSKPYLCQICKLCETCQNNFDYECVEASDFLYKKGDKDDYKRVVKELTKTFTTKDDELEKLVKSKGYTLDDKDHNALRG